VAAGMEKENSARAQGGSKNMTVEEYLKKVRWC
jgi:hypothetical protein